ncbi:MAG TPA: GMC family oxidoreductase [Casimicrobiaceae bacterium]|nr:GMC family oxidoreductase [Casimicrobiaceae bacterium]
MEPRAFDFDWIVIGSGFGGSVAALRLAERGYRVAVLECGRRFRDEDLPRSAWQLRRFFWAPMLGLKGILRLTPFKDVVILSGSGVGGGSLVYAATLYRAPSAYFRHPQWADLDDWEARLAPHYATAERMLGVVTPPFDSEADRLLKELGEHLGCADTFQKTRVGIHFGEPRKAVADPYFDGEGPARTGCHRCGACMMGCPYGAKNTLVRNYLYLAEKKGAAVRAERTVTDVRPLGGGDGTDGYSVAHERTGAWLAKDRRTTTARGVIVAAGALGTNRLLANCKARGSLPALSDRLGDLVRTNSETLVAVTIPGNDRLADSVAITGSIFPDPASHIEFVTFGRNADAMGFMFALLTGNASRLARPFLALGTALRHPVLFVRKLWPFGWSRRTIVTGVMQTLDNAIRFKAKRRWLRSGIRLSTEQDPRHPIPTFFPIANRVAEWLAKRHGGIAQSFLAEALFGVPTTAHILGGAVIGKDAEHGVIDARHEVFGYRNLLVCDGAAIPANPGVNPSLTITAMAEAAMARIPPKDAPPTVSESHRCDGIVLSGS